MTKTWLTPWSVSCALAALQLSVALAALLASRRDILSDMACIGGLFGTLANIVVRSSGTAILIGQYAALRCTV